VRAIGKPSVSPSLQIAAGKTMKLTAQVDRGYSVAGSSLVRDQSYGQARPKLRAMQESATPLHRQAFVPGAEAVSQLMPCEIYEADHDRDRQAQLAQMRLLAEAATSGE
jgi:hypothetical protein